MMKKYSVSLILLFSILGCTQNAYVDSQIEITSTPYQTSTLIPTDILVIPSSTSTLIPISPTNVIEDKESYTLELIETNNGCELPCWWGITPNKTKWSEVKDFFRSFSIVNGRKTPDWFVYLVRSPIDEEISNTKEIWSTLGVQDDVIKVIEITAFNEKTYYLNNFLQSTGKPDTILVSSYSSDAGAGKDTVPLTIAMYYPKLGILALYGSWANTSGNTITACFDAGPHLFLWSPNSSGKYAIEDFLSWDKDHIPYKSIEESTNLTIETFYEKYSNTKGELCLQSPRNIWYSQ